MRRQTLYAGLLALLTIAAAASLGGAVVGQGEVDDVAQTLQNDSDNDTGWPAPRADAGRTGATYESGPHPHGNTSWTASNTGRDPWGPAVTGDSVVMAYSGEDYPNGIVESYNASTGETRWTQAEIGNPVGPATTANGSVFVATVSDNLYEFQSSENLTGLYALDVSTGDIEWRINSTFSEPVVASGHVFVSERQYTMSHDESYGNVTAVDPATGERVWTSDVEGKVLAYADGRLIVGDEQSDTLYALDAADGSLRWQTDVEESTYLYDKVAATGDAVYVTKGTDPYPIENAPKAVTAFAAADGSERWTAEIEGITGDAPEYLSAPAVANGTVYVVTDGESVSYPGTGMVHALDADTGETEWDFQTEVNLRSDPAVGNGTVYVAGMYEFEEDWIQERGDDAYDQADWRLPFSWLTAYALDAEDGTERWNVMTDSAPNDDAYPGSAVADGQVYFTTHDSGLPGETVITAIESADEQPPWFYQAIDDQEFQNVGPDAEIDASPPSGEDGYYEANMTVTLNASTSTDPDGEIVSYEWDLDGDGEFEQTGKTIEVTTAANACQVVEVTLRVTDDDGATDTTTRTLQTEP